MIILILTSWETKDFEQIRILGITYVTSLSLQNSSLTVRV